MVLKHFPRTVIPYCKFLGADGNRFINSEAASLQAHKNNDEEESPFDPRYKARVNSKLLALSFIEAARLHKESEHKAQQLFPKGNNPAPKSHPPQ